MNEKGIIITDWLLKTKIYDINNDIFIYKLICINENNDKNIIKNIVKICKNIEDILLLPVAFFGVHIILNKSIDFCILHDNKKIEFKKININYDDDNLEYINYKLCERYLEVLSIKYMNNNGWIHIGNINNNIFISKNIKNVYCNKVNVEVRDKIRLNWIVNKDRIVLSFKFSYRIIEKDNILNTKEDILKNINPVYLINIETNKRLQFINYENEYCQNFYLKDKKSNLFDYIDDITKSKYKNLKNSKVINAYFCDSIISKENKRNYYFPACFLHLERNDIRNSIEFNKRFPSNKMDEIINILSNMLNFMKMEYEYSGLYLFNHNYKPHKLILPEEIRNNMYILKKNNPNKDIYTFEGILKYYILHSSVIDFNIINSFSSLIKKNNYGIKLIQEKILYYNKGTTYLKDIKSTNKKVVDKWINEVIEKKENIVLIFITNNEKDTSKYEDIKEYFKDKNIGTQCISLKIINKLLDDYKNNSKTFIYYLNNIIPQIAIKGGLNPNFHFFNKLKSKCFVGLDVSHIPIDKNNIKHVSGSVSCIFDKNGNLSFQDYGNIENGEKIIKKIHLNEKNTINKILDNLIKNYEQNNGFLPKNIVIHRDGFCRNSELYLIHDYFKKYDSIKYTVLSILKHIDKKIYLFENKKFKSSPIKAYINEINKEAYIITSTSFNKDKTSNPFKIKIIYTNDEYNIYDACEDIYLLSFPCHMRGFVKLRLPMTIYYSDESSTNRNKNYLEEDIIYNKLLCP